MTDQPRKYVAETRGRPFEPGNPGRPKGSRNKATLAAEALLDGEAEALTHKAIELRLQETLRHSDCAGIALFLLARTDQ